MYRSTGQEQGGLVDLFDWIQDVYNRPCGSQGRVSQIPCRKMRAKAEEEKQSRYLFSFHKTVTRPPPPTPKKNTFSDLDANAEQGKETITDGEILI